MVCRCGHSQHDHGVGAAVANSDYRVDRDGYRRCVGYIGLLVLDLSSVKQMTSSQDCVKIDLAQITLDLVGGDTRFYIEVEHRALAFVKCADEIESWVA